MFTRIDSAQALFSRLLYERHSRALRVYLLNRVRNPDDARELAQEVWTRLLRVREPSQLIDPRAYLYRVAANVLAEFYQQRRRDPVEFDSELFTTAAEASPSAEHFADRLHAQSDVLNALAPLSAMFREIVLLRLRSGLSYREIGLKLNLTAGTAERYFFSAMADVRAEWARKAK